MPTIFRVLSLTSACFILCTGLILGGDFEWKPISPSDWQISIDSSKKISDAVVIFENVLSDTRDWQKDKESITIYRRIRILTDEGREWGDVEVPIINTDQKILEIKGRTIERGSKITELTKDMIFKQDIVKVKGEKVKQTKFSLPGVTNDCIVEYMIKMEGGVFEWIIQCGIPVLNFEYRWLLPEFTVNNQFEQRIADKSLNPNYLFLNKSGEIQLQQLPNIKQPEELVFTTTDIPPFISEPFSLPDASMKSKLVCYLGSRDNPLSYWNDKANDIIDNQVEFSGQDKKLKRIVQSFGPLESDEEKIKAAYDWVTENIFNLTYFDLYDPKKKGEIVEPQDCKSVNDVIKYGYGWGTDICRVFCDMLREMNIDAKMAYARNRSEDLFMMDVKFWQFDNTLVAVKHGHNSYSYYTVGHAMTPQSIVPWYIEGVKVLIGDIDNNIATIPFSTNDQNTYNYVFTYNIDDELEVEGEFSSRLTGQPARSMKVAILDEDSADYDHLLLDEAKKRFDDKKINIVSHKGLDKRDDAVILNCKIEQPDLVETGGRILLKPFSFSTNSSNPFHAKDRKTPVLLNYAYQLREAIQFNFPPGWTIEALPADTTFQNQAGSCAVLFEKFGEGVSVQKQFILTVPFWTVDAYPEVRALYQARQDLSDLTVVLKRSGDSE